VLIKDISKPNAIKPVITNENTIIISEKGTIIKLARIEINEN
jgi:hypothetical protein